MNILLVGSGGREHALAWRLGQSPRLGRLYIAPGNPGTALLGQNVPIAVDDNASLVAFAQQNRIDLVIVGPEAPLAGGLADALRASSIRVFGPSRAAAQIESSKAFAKDLMDRHGIPTARYGVFSRFEDALGFVRAAEYPIVLKASGLAAGKGVILPSSPQEAETELRRMMVNHEFGPAGDQVVIEERLKGEEVSLLAFTDGTTVKPMPPAQDHKRLCDGDIGPNTGGMGAYAPMRHYPTAQVAEWVSTILQPAVDGLRKEGCPFVGVLYAGLMITPQGPRVLEFNCRFGDPETQALMPLLDSDLVEIAVACADGRLSELEIEWKPGAAACVVLASEGYPGKHPVGRIISGLDQKSQATVIFHAGTRRMEDGQIATAGGRVLGVTAWGDTLPEALARAYAAVERVRFEGMQYRRDIGARGVRP
jgi:phosphoribosylamine--glycine ligase